MILINNEKDKIRKELRGKFSTMKAVDRDFADFAICESLNKLSEIKNAEVIAVYAAIGYEVDLHRFIIEAIEQGKRICLPRALNKTQVSHLYELAEISSESDLIIGKFNIPEPGMKCQVCPIQNIDAWLVPGIAFDPAGNRLGRGAGVYDRLLMDATGPKIGVLYQIQMMDSLPCEKHDLKMDMLVTEKETIKLNTV